MREAHQHRAIKTHRTIQPLSLFLFSFSLCAEDRSEGGQEQDQVLAFFTRGLTPDWLSLPGRDKLLARLVNHFLTTTRDPASVRNHKAAMLAFTGASGSRPLPATKIQAPTLVVHGDVDQVGN